MRLLSLPLCLSWVLALCLAAPPHHKEGHSDPHHKEDYAHPDQHGHPDQHAHPEHSHHHDLVRCSGIEFDAITLDEHGVTYFIKDDHLWKGYRGSSEFTNQTFHELHGSIDAAFRMHHKVKPEDHDRVFIFKGDHVWSFYNHTLEDGFPKLINSEFPGIPYELDAAVECPSGECKTDSVLFFKGSHVYHYDLLTHSVKEKYWPAVMNCTSAYRWLERYFCFQGTKFQRFHPVTGHVSEGYPKDVRDYFMKCPDRGHGDKTREALFGRCSGKPFDAFTADDEGKIYAFRGDYFLRLDTKRDGYHYWSITSNWKELHDHINAVFTWDHKMYFIQGDQVYIYKSDVHYTLVEGYPKPVEEELGVKGPVDAAFLCGDSHLVHIIQGKRMLDVDMSETPRKVVKEWPLPFDHVDAAMCGAEGIRVFIGDIYYEYRSPMLLATSRMQPFPHKTRKELLGCDN
ncbi:hemopexin-like [Huso huso]|uniref:Hemopexin-like n=1 Tax=Huso huso TaxID=61971 RepID=A0ABR0ZPG5_HUSHU